MYIDLALEHHPDLVIVEFGANDMLEGVHPKATSQNLDAIISIIQAHGARVILAGMLSLPKMVRTMSSASTISIRLSHGRATSR